MRIYEDDCTRKISLREARAMRKTSQCYIQKETGVPQSRISKIENDYVQPTDEEKTLIAEALGVDSRYIAWPALSGKKGGKDGVDRSV